MNDPIPDPLSQIEAALDDVERAACDCYTAQLGERRMRAEYLGEVRGVLLDLIRSAIAQQPRLCGDKRPCDAGEICIGCQPRECPDAQRTRQGEQDVRTSFERWMSDEGRFPRAVERRGNGYTLLQSNTCWDAWEAAARVFLASPAPPTPAPDEAAMRIASKWRHARWCVVLDPEETSTECTCGLDDYLAGRVSQSVRATFETWWESERLNPGINYSAAFEAGYRAALRGEKK